MNLKPIKKMALFYTPEDTQYIQDWIERLPAEQKIVGYTVMGMTWNFLAEAINKKLKEVENEIQARS